MSWDHNETLTISGWRRDVVEHLKRELHLDSHKPKLCKFELPLEKRTSLQAWNRFFLLVLSLMDHRWFIGLYDLFVVRDTQKVLPGSLPTQEEGSYHSARLADCVETPFNRYKGKSVVLLKLDVSFKYTEGSGRVVRSPRRRGRGVTGKTRRRRVVGTGSGDVNGRGLSDTISRCHGKGKEVRRTIRRLPHQTQRGTPSRSKNGLSVSGSGGSGP